MNTAERVWLERHARSEIEATILHANLKRREASEAHALYREATEAADRAEEAAERAWYAAQRTVSRHAEHATDSERSTWL